MQRITEQKISQGVDLIKLGIGDPDLRTPYPILEALKNEADQYHQYPDSKGMKELREALAQHYTVRFPRKKGYTADNFVIGMGAKTDLFSLTQLFANKGDKVLSFDPAYPVFVNRASFEGFDIKYLSANEGNDFRPLPSFQFKPKELDEIKSEYLCLPNNPTGQFGRKKYLKQQVDEAHNHGFTIIYDSAYSDFAEEPTVPNIMQIPGADEVAVDIGSFSKPFSMTGFRVSSVCADGELLKRWKQYKANMDSGTSNYMQKAALAALTDPRVPPIVKGNMKVYAGRAKMKVDRSTTSLNSNATLLFPRLTHGPGFRGTHV